MAQLKLIHENKDLEKYAREFSSSDMEKAIGSIDNTKKYYFNENYYIQYLTGKSPTVFISHKHADLPKLKGLLGLLTKTYGVSVYIDSSDPSMPSVTSDVTAKRIKHKIRECDKFILLATDGAVDSKWCNWELGFGDARKFERSISLFPLKNDEEKDDNYKGKEYMRIYPHIAFKSACGFNFYTGTKDDYCVVLRKDGREMFIPLSDWLWKNWTENDLKLL